VLLPPPVEPTKATISPASILKEISLRIN